MMDQALGLIEVIGLVPAIEGADSALKAANVTLLGVSKVGADIVTVALVGDVGAVNAAVEAGGQAAARVGTLRTTHVIARLAPQVRALFLQAMMVQAPRAKAPDAPKIATIHHRISDLLGAIPVENKVVTVLPDEPIPRALVAGAEIPEALASSGELTMVTTEIPMLAKKPRRPRAGKGVE